MCKTTLLACLLSLSLSANAVVMRNGLQWLELTETVNLSRSQVEARMADSSDELSGYRYASRLEVEQLLLSYASWDGKDGRHSAPGVISGFEQYFADFGSLVVTEGNGTTFQIQSADGYLVNLEHGNQVFSQGLYGLDGECGIGLSCLQFSSLYLDDSDTATMAWQNATDGWDSKDTNVRTRSTNSASSFAGSYLVQVSEVPLPAAAWLFISAIGGLGVLKRVTK